MPFTACFARDSGIVAARALLLIQPAPRRNAGIDPVPIIFRIALVTVGRPKRGRAVVVQFFGQFALHHRFKIARYADAPRRRERIFYPVVIGLNARRRHHRLQYTAVTHAVGRGKIRPVITAAYKLALGQKRIHVAVACAIKRGERQIFAQAERTRCFHSPPS